jgi:putative transposase
VKQGLKPEVLLESVMARLKPCRCYKAEGKARVRRKDFGPGGVEQGLKPEFFGESVFGPAEAVPLLQSRRVNSYREGRGALAAAMAHPARNAAPANILSPSRIFFATTSTAMGKRLLQSERNAGLLIDVLRSLAVEKHFRLHDFVIMPDHVHLLVEVCGDMTIEKAMQLVKGRFSRRLGKELGFKGEVWHRGFTEVQVMNKQSFEAHRAYIAENPIKAGLATTIEEYPFCFRFLARKKEELARGAELSRG